MVHRGGFEPPYVIDGQIYSLLPLTTRPPVHIQRFPASTGWNARLLPTAQAKAETPAWTLAQLEGSGLSSRSHEGTSSKTVSKPAVQPAERSWCRFEIGADEGI